MPLPNEKKLSQIYSQVYHYDPNRIRDYVSSLVSTRELNSDKLLIEKYKKSGRVLDIGAGRGDFLLQFSKKNWEMWAYDPYLLKSDISVLKEKIGIHANDFRSLHRYPRNLFDVIVLRNVVEHTSHFLELVHDVQKLLKKDGILFIRTPNMDSFDFKIFKTKWWALTMPGHLVFFNKQSMDTTLKKSAFVNEFTKGTSRSSLLSFARSFSDKLPLPILAIPSFFFSCVSPFFGEGGDLLVIAKKS